jgi:hypothetical protein
MYETSASSDGASGPSLRPPSTQDSRVPPSSSRMITNYLADVEQNLDEHRWEMALRDVIDLPRIAVALSDPEMKSSSTDCKAWCERWIRASGDESEPAVAADHVCRVLSERADDHGDGSAIPAHALRRLRLRRHARNAPRGFNSVNASKDDPRAKEAFAVCAAVVEGVRRWYAHFAVHDSVAQTNLARLAVLR